MSAAGFPVVAAAEVFFQPHDLIKMDIQGYELHALHGAMRVWTDNPEIKLLPEFWAHG
jgi:hypothetical protein